MNAFTRYLQRRRLLKEAEKLEAEARQLRRSLLETITSHHGPVVGLGAIATSIFLEHQFGSTAGVTKAIFEHPEGKRVQELEAKAAELRKETERC